MEWEAFLDHPEVKNSKSHIPAGQYLLGKVLHDVSDCLTSFRSLVDMAASLPGIPNDVHNWFSKWLPVFENWIKSLHSFWNYYSEETDSRSFPGILQKICSILSDAHLPSLETKGLTLPHEKASNDIVESAINNVVRLNLIYQDLLTKKYLLLWKTDYKDLHLKN